MTVTHRCRWCDSDYPCDTFVQGEDEHGHFRSACDCKVKDACRECSPELYKPICGECDENGDYTLATQVIDAPWGRVDLCEKHYDQAGERGAEMWKPEDVGAGERMSAAYALDRSQK